MTNIVSLEHYVKLNTRINKYGDNCNIGDIITWSMSKNKQQLFGIIRNKHSTCLNVDLLDYKIFNNSIILTETRKIDAICHNVLKYTRKIIIINHI